MSSSKEERERIVAAIFIHEEQGENSKTHFAERTELNR